jgi:hypothetical protein
MQFQIFLFFLLSSHQCFIITTALFNHEQNNSLINIHLYQCYTNETIVDNTILNNTDTIFDSCDLDCCLTNDSNQTSNFNTCQVTTQSPTGVCLGRLCYPGECDEYVLLTNLTYYEKLMDNTTFMNEIRSSFSSIPWSSFANSTRIQWGVWKNKNDSSIQYSILILLSIVNISLTLLALCVIIKSIKHANKIAEKKAHRYSLF